VSLTDEGEGEDAKVLQQFDAVLRGHLCEPTFAMVMEAKTTVHPRHFAEVLKKAASFESFVARADKCRYSSGWKPIKVSSPFAHFGNVQRVVPCLAGSRFPLNLVEECLSKGIVPIFPSGARYVAKGLDLFFCKML
jgi:hypothetical protein